MSTMSNIECLYQSLNVNDLTMNECFSTKKYQKNSKSLSRHITITITYSESSYDSY